MALALTSERDGLSRKGSRVGLKVEGNKIIHIVLGLYYHLTQIVLGEMTSFSKLDK